MRVKKARANVSVEGKGLPDWKEGRSLGLLFRRERFPFGATNGPEEYGLGVFADGLG